MNKTMQAVLRALSYGGIEVEATRRLADLKKLDPMRIYCTMKPDDKSRLKQTGI